MKYALWGASALSLFAMSAHAGGIERSNLDYGLLFNDGNNITLSFSNVSPNVSGEYTPVLTALGGTSDTGNMAGDYASLGFTYTNQINDKFTLGVYANQPYGADALYVGGFYNDLRAEWDSEQLAVIGRYKVADRVSVFGGFRYVHSSADITIPDQMIRASTARAAQSASDAATALVTAGVPTSDARVVQATALATQLGTIAAGAASLQYDAQGPGSGEWGYVLGAAYEIPDIALRVALTYESAITHTFDAAETLPGYGLNVTGETEVEMPQTVTLDFQTGVAPGTLVFGSIRWAEWSKWEVRPDGYDGLFNSDITSFENDTTTWSLGVGRQFNENFSGFVQASFEKENGGVSSRLAPTDGRKSLGIGGQFTQDNMKMRFGVQYVKVGDATDASGVEFAGNDAWGVGLSVNFGF